MHCVFQLESSSRAVKLNSTERTNVSEKESVLRFLVALAGSVRNESTSVLGHQDRFWVTEHKQVFIVYHCPTPLKKNIDSL